MDKKSIAQMHSVVLNGDAVSNIMRTLDTIHKEEGWNSSSASKSGTFPDKTA